MAEEKNKFKEPLDVGTKLLGITDTMEHVSNPLRKLDRLLEKGIESITQGRILSALYCFKNALNLEDSPIISSYFAFCIAKGRREVNKGISLCMEAIRKEPQNPIHYLNLGRIYLLSNKRADALNIFRKGLSYKENQRSCMN